MVGWEIDHIKINIHINIPSYTSCIPAIPGRGLSTMLTFDMSLRCFTKIPRMDSL